MCTECMMSDAMSVMKKGVMEVWDVGMHKCTRGAMMRVRCIRRARV